VQVNVSEAPPFGNVTVTCPVRSAVAIQIALTNPCDK
jgi:hypothetical protein